MITDENCNSSNELIRIARIFYQKGWMVGTSGNLSVRSGDEELLITASGRPKGDLSLGDLVSVSLQDGSLGRCVSVRPSAEVSIHQTIYRCRKDAGAVFHIHSVDSNVVSEWAREGLLSLPPLEMLKGVGIVDPSNETAIPVFENHLEVQKIAHDLSRFLQKEGSSGEGTVPAFLIRHHGLTVWGRDLMDAFHRVELMEYLFRFMVIDHLSGQAGMGAIS